MPVLYMRKRNVPVVHPHGAASCATKGVVATSAASQEGQAHYSQALGFSKPYHRNVHMLIFQRSESATMYSSRTTATGYSNTSTLLRNGSAAGTMAGAGLSDDQVQWRPNTIMAAGNGGWGALNVSH